MATVPQRFGAGHRVLVTGGAGFVGSHLVDALIGRGCDVVALDNLVTGWKDNVAHLDGNARFTLVEADISEGLPDDGRLAERFDAVMHFACPASPTDFVKLPVEILKVDSLGTFHCLDRALADGARFLFASTSEVYGDPLVHPQPESYWGNVNPIGIRSVYDEAKRFSEAATMAYRRTHGLDTGMVRIFNSVLADEVVVYDDGVQLRCEPIGELAKRVGDTVPLVDYTVPAFGADGAVGAAEASWIVGHPTEQRCYRVVTRYGRSIRVTGDHSLFTKDPVTRAPVARPATDLSVGDKIAIAGRLDVIERDRKLVSMLDVIDQSGIDPWTVAVSWPGLSEILHAHRHELVGLIASRRAGSSRQSSWGTLHRWRTAGTAPLAAIRRLGLSVPAEAMIRRYAAGAKSWLPVSIEITDEFLWLLGLFVAEGCIHDRRPKSSFLTITCEEAVLGRFDQVVQQVLGTHVVRAPATPQRAGSRLLHSQLLVDLWRFLGLAGPDKRIPGWVLGLPLSRLKWFLEGYREGDGVHGGLKLAEAIRHEFSTTSTGLKDDLVIAFARFGLCPSVGRYETTFKRRTGDRRYPFWRLTLCHVTPWSPLEWDSGVVQHLQADRYGDLIWADVTNIEEIDGTSLVYDFCVPGRENFWAGTGVMAHNTYGPAMRPGDGRAIPTFICQALRGEPLTVAGDGSQTRSICYVDDLVRGILAVLDSELSEPVNLGTEHELSMRELAETIVRLTGSMSRISYVPRPADDPSVRRPDLTLARTALGYEPRVSPDEGLRRTIEYFARHLGLKV